MRIAQILQQQSESVKVFFASVKMWIRQPLKIDEAVQMVNRFGVVQFIYLNMIFGPSGWND